MLKKRTTLILGAGASQPYGFPLGIGLRDALLSTASNFRSTLQQLQTPLEHWERVVRILRATQFDSIDEFLAAYGEHSEIVKLGVAFWINFAENVETVLDQSRADHWYKALVLRVLQNDPALGDGSLTIVTFNYDLSLEAYCYEVIVNRHRKTPEQAREALKNLRITHIYGTLGTLKTAHGDGREFRTIGDAQELARAAKMISTCYELESAGAVAEARKMIRESEVVLFLGFGFSKENLARLDFGNSAQKAVKILGSVYRCPEYWRFLGDHLHNTNRFTAMQPHPETTAPAMEALDWMWRAANQE
jgi:hypothetical protein